MATKLDKTIDVELDSEGKLYTVTMSHPRGVKITAKGGAQRPARSRGPRS